MADEIEISEREIVGVNGDVVVYGRIVNQQQMDYNALQQNSAALNSETQMVRITNKSTTAIRYAVRPAGSFTISVSNSDVLLAGDSIDEKVTKNAGMIVSTINA